MTAQEAQRPAPRLPELSAGNLAFCGMVLLLHLCSDTIVQAPTGTVFYGLVFTLWQLSAVAVYGFLFLSGLKAQLGRPRPLKEYYVRRARAILPGYLLWSAVYLALRAVLGGGLAPGRMAVELLTGGAAAHLRFMDNRRFIRIGARFSAIFPNPSICRKAQKALRQYPQSFYPLRSVVFPEQRFLSPHAKLSE